MVFNMISSLLFLLVVSTSMVCSTHAYDFYVGDKDGWVLCPSESFNKWAGRNRFQIHDNLVFKYKKGDDMVLEVRHDDYLKCNTSNPIKTMGSGESWFTFDRTGPFFFISGYPGHCDKGQKMIVVVLAKRHESPGGIVPSPSPSPSMSPPPCTYSPPYQMSPSPSEQQSSSPPSSDTPTSSGPAPVPAPSPSTSGSVVLMAPMMMMALILGGSVVGIF